MSDEEKKVESKGLPKSLFFIIIALILILTGAAATGLLIKQQPQILGLSKGTIQAQSEASMLISQVGKLIDLPKDETPTIATITDISKLKDQPFFANAKNGDKVLIYTNAKKAILYRPSENRIIEVGAVNINQQPVAQPSSSPSATPSPSPKASQ